MNSRYTQNRLVALDWMRGLVMALMVLDHASAFYNPGRLVMDSVVTYSPGIFLPLDQFFTRWVTHLCAPTFIFLAGTSLALSCRYRREMGVAEKTITIDLLIRGLIIALLDIVWLSYVGGHGLVLQVLYAIGFSMVVMAWLRRLDVRLLFLVVILWFLCGEAITRVFWPPLEGNPSVWVGLAIAPLYSINLTIIYPVIPWLAVMILGWVFGCYICQKPVLNQLRPSPERILVVSGVLFLIAFGVIRSANKYGNMLLLRGNDSLAQWLHVSKYPPSLSYYCLELGIIALLIALFLWRAKQINPSSNNPFLVFGQTALFFYICHLSLLGLPAFLFDFTGKGSLMWAYYAAFIALVCLYPVCLVYRRYKRTHPHSWVRFL